MKVYKKNLRIERNDLEQPVTIKIGDELYSPTNVYGPEKRDEYIVTTVDKIYEENGVYFIVDSDGDVLEAEWFGTEYFMTKEDMEFSRGCQGNSSKRKEYSEIYPTEKENDYER